MKKNTPVSSHAEVTAPADPAEHIDPLDWIERAKAGTDVARAISRQLWRRRRHRAGIAAAGAAILFMGAFRWQGPWREVRNADRLSPASAIVTLPVRQILPDGSIVELKAGATVEPAFTPALRKIILLRGEAHFQVIHDAARPFVVSVGGVEVQAVGTAFSVQFGKTSVEVLVTEGRVAVQPAVSPSSSPPAAVPAPTFEIFVDAGSLAVVGLDAAAFAIPPKVLPMPTVELKERLAWRVPQLQFSGTPLSEVIAMINAHGPVRLTLGSEALGKVRISGVLRADNLDTLLELLAESHGIKTEHRGASEMVLTHAR